MKGVGLGWRPETAWLIDQRASLGFTEVIAELIDPARPPAALAAAVARGLPVITHGVGLSLGGAQPVDHARLRRLTHAAQTLRSPLVSEHVAFCRAGGAASPHFLPVPHTRAQLAILVDNVRRTIDALPAPLVLENVAAPLRWPGDELHEADFLAELVDRTGARLLLDVANLHANLVNHGGDLDRYLDRLPLDRIAYLHVAGGARVDVMWRDTHGHPLTPPIIDVLARVLARTGPRPLLLERDDHFGTRGELEAELDQLATLHAATAAPPPQPRPVRDIDLPRMHRTLRTTLEHAQRALIDCVTGTRALAAFDPIGLAEARTIARRKAISGACPRR